MGQEELILEIEFFAKFWIHSLSQHCKLNVGRKTILLTPRRYPAENDKKLTLKYTITH